MTATRFHSSFLKFCLEKIFSGRSRSFMFGYSGTDSSPDFKASSITRRVGRSLPAIDW